MIVTDEELCKWLKENGSGVYRQSAEAAHRIIELKSPLEYLRELIVEKDKNVL